MFTSFTHSRHLSAEILSNVALSLGAPGPWRVTVDFKIIDVLSVENNLDAFESVIKKLSEFILRLMRRFLNLGRKTLTTHGSCSVYKTQPFPSSKPPTSNFKVIQYKVGNTHTHTHHTTLTQGHSKC
jgi:hypothetical protein